MYLLFSDPKTRLRAVSIMIEDQITSTSENDALFTDRSASGERASAVTMLEAEMAEITDYFCFSRRRWRSAINWLQCLKLPEKFLKVQF